MTPDLQSLGLRWRQIRFNPLRSLTPERLASALDSAAAGWLREAALIYETIEQREAIVRSVMTKRRASVARRDWQVIIPDKTDPRAEAHKATLEYFYNNLTVTDATDLNVRTGMAGLLRQMMDAVIQRYAVHEIVWQPSAAGLTAELRRVPLYFFENRSGALRFIGPETRADGTPLEDDGWMITVADGLGEALSICYMYKRLAVQDWLAFSEKFSVPGVLGRTSALKDSDAGIAMRDSVLAYASEWQGVIYGDDNSIPKPLEIIQTPAGANLPQQLLAEYMDRAIATLVRGGDLSTISRKDATGSNPQQDETEALIEDDCAMVSETLQTQLDRLVIRMVHGDETPAAYVVVNPPSNKDLSKDIVIDQALAGLGVKQDPQDLAERYGREMAAAAPIGPISPIGPIGPISPIPPAANAYNPLQARNPKGVRVGGRWTKDGGLATGSGMDDNNEETDDARHAELEAKHNAGTITPEETAEAERIVAERAKAAEPDITYPKGNPTPMGSRWMSKTFEDDSAYGYLHREDAETAFGKPVEGNQSLTLNQIQKAAKRGNIYVRWTEGFKTDKKANFGSLDALSLNRHAGVSAVNIDPAWSPEYMAKRLSEYEFTRMKGDAKPTIIEGSKIGEDTDGYDLIYPTQYLGTWDQNTNPAAPFTGTPIYLRFQTKNTAANKTTAANIASSPVTDDQSTVDQSMHALRTALAADMQPIGKALEAAYRAKDLPAIRGALKKISASLPDLAGESAATEAELARQMAAAYLGDSSPMTNDQ